MFKAILKAWWRRFSAFFIMGLVFFFVGLFILVQIFIYYSQDLPDYKQLEEYSPASITRIYSSEGELMSELARERRIYVDYDEIPQLVINAFLAAEDRNFFEHSGIDFISIFRALVQNILNVGRQKNLVGGSTITQQVIKNFLLTNERTIARKIKEAILSYRVSKAYSKEKILELYLNELFLGDNSYGILVAANNYFDKNLDQLSIEEAAILAALPKSPTFVNPRSYPARATERRDWVIGRMVAAEFITKEQGKVAQETPLKLAPRKMMLSSKYPYYAEEVRRQLMAMYGEEAVYTQGFTVITNMNKDMQEKMNANFKKHLEELDGRGKYRGAIANIPWTEDWLAGLKAFKAPPLPFDYVLGMVLATNAQAIEVGMKNGEKVTLPKAALSRVKDYSASTFKKGDIITMTKKEEGYVLVQTAAISGGMISLEPYSGKVFAFVGGYDYNESNFNRAFQAKRQPGSAFKPFVYLTALERGYPPNTIILDEPVAISQGPGLPMWRPKNYTGTYLGPITLRQSMEKSRNLSTVRLLKSVGIDRVIELSERFKVYENPPRNFAICLGAHETTLAKLANAYNSFASDGHLTNPNLIAGVYSNKGKQIFNGVKSECNSCDVKLLDYLSNDAPQITYDIQRVMDAETNFQFVSLLEGVILRGTAQRAKSLGKAIAGKTGTTNDSKDVWFIGFTPEITTGVYIGYDIPKDMGKKATGSSHALPVFISYMGEVLHDVPNKAFLPPSTLDAVAINYQTGKPINHNIYRKKNNFNFGFAFGSPKEEEEELNLEEENTKVDGRNVITEYFKTGNKKKTIDNIIEQELSEEEETGEDGNQNGTGRKGFGGVY